MPRSGKAVELLRAAARGLGLSLGDHTIALERREVLSHGVVCNAEPFRQIFDGKALLILEKKVSNCCCRSPSKVIMGTPVCNRFNLPQ